MTISRRTLLFAAVFLSLSAPTGLRALDFTVDRIDDPEPTTANGCDDATLNDCSLRGAILKSNADPLTSDVIHLPAGTYTLSIPATVNENNDADGDLDVVGNASLVGDGAATTIIDGNHAVTQDRALDLNPGPTTFTVSVSGVTITGGGPINNAFIGLDGNGGGVAVHAGNATLDHVIIRDNMTGDGSGFIGAGAGGFGGGISIDRGTTLIKNSVISGNITGNGQTGFTGPPANDGGHGGDGGGVYINTTASVTIQDATISGNRTGDGGSGVVVTATSNGSAGGAAGAGGGIELADGTLTLKNVTVANNKTGNGGPGGSTTGLHQGGNGGGGGLGGGIHTLLGTLTLNNVTVTGNQTGDGGAGGDGEPPSTAGFNGPGGGLTRQGGTFSVGNTIVAGNAISTSPIGQAASGPDCNGNFVSNGFNLIGTGSGCAGFTGGVNNDLVGADAKLDPAGLKGNGGDTETVALLSGSPAIDTGQNGSCETNDQRGQARLDGDANGTATCDIGAFEFEICGDGQVTIGEGCDDGNNGSGDGCSDACAVESGFTCEGSPSVCTEGGATAGTTTGGTAGTAGGTAGTGNGTATGGGGNGGGCSLLR